MSRFNRITCRSLRATLRLELTATGAFLMTLPHVAELALEMATRWALDSSERSGLRQSRAVIRSLLYLLPCRILGLVLSNDRLAAAAELEIAWGDTRSRQTRLGRDQDTTETIRVSSKHGCRRRRRGRHARAREPGPPGDGRTAHGRASPPGRGSGPGGGRRALNGERSPVRARRGRARGDRASRRAAPVSALAAGGRAGDRGARGDRAPPARVLASRASAAERLRKGRTCYDHLAGRLGVGITDALLARRALRRSDGGFIVTGRGERLLGQIEVDIGAARGQRRAFALACWLDRAPLAPGGRPRRRGGPAVRARVGGAAGLRAGGLVDRGGFGGGCGSCSSSTSRERSEILGRLRLIHRSCESGQQNKRDPADHESEVDRDEDPATRPEGIGRSAPAPDGS